MEQLTLGGGRVLSHHPIERCAGERCPLHNPSRHKLTFAPMEWCSSRRTLYRICQHGLEHPDPDDLWYKRVKMRMLMSLLVLVRFHDCDGCCGEGDPILPVYSKPER